MYKKNGSVYVGEFFEGDADGEGHYVKIDGSYYEGKVKDSKANDLNGYYWTDKF
jgi:hypothetical protein